MKWFNNTSTLVYVRATHAGSSHGLCLDDLDIKALLKEDDEDQQAPTVGGEKVYLQLI